MNGRPRLGIVLVNWNRWPDTLECLESLLASTIPLRIVIVDNASSDGSRERIIAWAAGDQPAVPVEPGMARFSQPPAAKPVGLAVLSATDAALQDPGNAPTTLIDGGGNLGFAGGNNAGLRHLLRDPGIQHFWLLNNDTVVEPGAAEALLRRMEATHRIGMCGAQVRYYHRPDTIQALNGHRFNPLTGASSGIGRDTPAKAGFDPARIARETDFVFGAALGVSRAFLEAVGPMSERYFLYFEEIDWATRARGRFATAFAQAAIVYHKEGGSIGSSGKRGQRSPTSEYYLLRARHRYIAAHRPYLLPAHWLVSLGAICARVVRGQPGKAGAMLRALVGLPY